MRCDVWEIKRVLVNQGRYADILYSNAFERLHLDLDDLKVFQGSLVEFSGKHVQLKGYITPEDLIWDKKSARMIKVRYLVIEIPSYIT